MDIEETLSSSEGVVFFFSSDDEDDLHDIPERGNLLDSSDEDRVIVVDDSSSGGSEEQVPDEDVDMEDNLMQFSSSLSQSPSGQFFLPSLTDSSSLEPGDDAVSSRAPMNCEPQAQFPPGNDWKQIHCGHSPPLNHDMVFPGFSGDNCILPANQGMGPIVVGSGGWMSIGTWSNGADPLTNFITRQQEGAYGAIGQHLRKRDVKPAEEENKSSEPPEAAYGFYGASSPNALSYIQDSMLFSGNSCEIPRLSLTIGEETDSVSLPSDDEEVANLFKVSLRSSTPVKKEEVDILADTVDYMEVFKPRDDEEVDGSFEKQLNQFKRFVMFSPPPRDLPRERLRVNIDPQQVSTG